MLLTLLGNLVCSLMDDVLLGSFVDGCSVGCEFVKLVVWLCACLLGCLLVVLAGFVCNWLFGWLCFCLVSWFFVGCLVYLFIYLFQNSSGMHQHLQSVFQKFTILSAGND